MVWRVFVLLLIITLILFALYFIYPSAAANSMRSIKPLLTELGIQLDTHTEKRLSQPDTTPHLTVAPPKVTRQQLPEIPEKTFYNLNGHSDIVNMFSGISTPTCGALKREVFSLQTQFNDIENFKLNLTGEPVSPYVEYQAQQALNVVYMMFKHFFNQLAHKKALSPIQLNMHIAAKDADYNELILSRDAEPAGTLGMYFLFQNQGFINGGRTEEETLRTLIHESVHALVFYYFGVTPRWVTEGLAEYFEHLRITETGQFSVYLSDEDWLTKEGILKSRFAKLDINTLFNSENQWQTMLSATLYANSYLFTGFMVEHNSNAFFEYLRQESSNPCNIVPAQNIEQLFRNFNENVESQFEGWRNTPRQIQRGAWQ
ncbi:DUF1570 domain-containing protein [Pseudoalteromonas piscicida]|uniref:DUF1570 domain-containing protein n=1 Tax=Pseudoalteromonas piscicida TaxID=43662 RepID=UPI003C7AB297